MSLEQRILIHDDTDDDNDHYMAMVWEAGHNRVAFAIAANLHELRLLQLACDNLTKGVHAILEGCPHLECLDLTACPYLEVNDELLARCAKIRHVWLPGRWPRVHCPDLHTIAIKQDDVYEMEAMFSATFRARL